MVHVLVGAPPRRSPENAPERVSAAEGRRLIAEDQKQAKKSSQMQKFKARFEEELVGLPEPEREVAFHPRRKWRLDYAWPKHKIAVELQGGIFGKGGHVRGLQYSKDREKMVEAQKLGWIVFEVTEVHLRERSVHDWIEAALRSRGMQ